MSAFLEVIEQAKQNANVLVNLFSNGCSDDEVCFLAGLWHDFEVGKKTRSIFNDKGEINQSTKSWLDACGGAWLSKVDNEHDLLEVTLGAPCDLTFGLAYARVCDYLMFSGELALPQVSFLSHNKQTPPFSGLDKKLSEVLDLGYGKMSALEASNSKYHQSIGWGLSREPKENLLKCLLDAPCEFSLGFSTSLYMLHVYINSFCTSRCDRTLVCNGRFNESNEG